jgi:predicted dehydrogenase
MIRFGILGTARITRPFFEQPLDMVSIDAIASRDASKAEAFAAEFNIPRAHGSYDSLLADSGIDAGREARAGRETFGSHCRRAEADAGGM